ncbi:hypothetical protein [Streptomyces sp. NPDC044948]|uniref:hypothetical protein n=1 Tax=Streptomyces sp. NPDC044948 TaxID=3157092 RepID=UPI00340AD4A6
MPYTPPVPGQHITPALLEALAGPWQPYTATLSGITLGADGSVITRYQIVTNKVLVAWNVNWGSATSGNMPTISLPVPAASLGGMRWSGDVTIGPGAGSYRSGSAYLTDSGTAISAYALTSTAGLTSSLSSAGISMVAGGFIQGNIEYEF